MLYFFCLSVRLCLAWILLLGSLALPDWAVWGIGSAISSQSQFDRRKGEGKKKGRKRGRKRGGGRERVRERKGEIKKKPNRLNAATQNRPASIWLRLNYTKAHYVKIAGGAKSIGKCPLRAVS